MEMSLGGVRHNFYRFIPEGRKLIISLFMACLLATSPIHGAPTCPQKIDVHKVGFCSSDGSYNEWECRDCPPGLGHLIQCGKVYNYDKVINVDCQPCKKGTYSDTYDSGQCKKCTSCQKNQFQTGECNSQKDTIQCFCNRGFYKAHGHCMPCSWCCGNNTNEYVEECKTLEKKCSFQTVKICAPTTPPSTTTKTSAVSTLLRTEKTSSNSSDPTEPTPTKNSSVLLNYVNTTETSNNPKSPIDFTKTKEGPSDSRSGHHKEQDGKILPIAVVTPVLFIVVFVGILVYFRRRSGNSSSGDSKQVSRSNSTSIELHSSVPLITGAEEKKNFTIENTEICMCSKDTDAYAKGPENVPFLTTSGDQEKLGGTAEETITGRDFPSNTCLESPSCTCTITPDTEDDTEDPTESAMGQLSTGIDVPSLATCMDTPNIKYDTENAGQLIKEEKLDLPVTELPLKIYCKVCALLDPEDPFFRDYRMVAEKIGVSKEQTRALKKPPTDSLLIEHKPKVKVLMEILEGMKREDVMEVVEEWLSQC